MSTLKKKKYDNIEDLSKSEIKTILNRMGVSLDRSNHPKSYYISLYNSAQKAKHKVTRDDTSFAFNGNKATTKKRKRSLKPKKELKSEALESIEEDSEDSQSPSKKQNESGKKKINETILNRELFKEQKKNESKFKFIIEKDKSKQNMKMMSYKVQFDNEGQKEENNKKEPIIENSFVKYNMENDKDDKIIIEKEPIKVSIQMKNNSFVVDKKVPKVIDETHNIRYNVAVKNDNIDNIFMNYKVDLENDTTTMEIKDKQIPIVHNVIKIKKEPKEQQKMIISSNIFKSEPNTMIKESTFVSLPKKAEIINTIFEIPKEIEASPSIRNNAIPSEEEQPKYQMLETMIKEEPIKENVFIQKEEPNEKPIEEENEPEVRYIEEENPEIVYEEPEEVKNANLIEYNNDDIPIKEEEKIIEAENMNNKEEGGIEYDDNEFKRPEQPHFIYNQYVPQNQNIPVKEEEDNKEGLIEYNDDDKEDNEKGLIEYNDDDKEEGLIEYSDDNNKQDEVMQDNIHNVEYNNKEEISNTDNHPQSTEPKYHFVNESLNQTSINKQTNTTKPIQLSTFQNEHHNNNSQQPPYIINNPFTSSIPHPHQYYNTASNHHNPSTLYSQSISDPAPSSSSIPLTTSIQNAIISVSNDSTEHVPLYTMYTYPPNKQPLPNNVVIFTSFLSAFIIIAFLFSFQHPETMSSLYHSNIPLNTLYIILILIAIIVIYKIVSIKRKYKQIAIDDYRRLKTELHNRRINSNVETDSVIMEEFIVDASTLHQIAITDYNIHVLPLLREMISKDRFIIETSTVVMNDIRVLWREI